MPVRLTIEEVRERVEAGGCKLVSTTYSSVKAPLNIVCSCGQYASIGMRWNAEACRRKEIHI